MVGRKVLVERTIHETIAEAKVAMSHDFLKTLEMKVSKLVVEAIVRAKANGRRTVMPRDL